MTELGVLVLVSYISVSFLLGVILGIFFEKMHNKKIKHDAVHAEGEQ